MGLFGMRDSGLSVENFEKGDVQSRQCVVVQEAIALAAADGFDWLLHVDIDELWYSPVPSAQRDAPSVFAAAPDSVTEIIFPNHEAVPQLEDSDCWFTSHTLFKVASTFTRSAARATGTTAATIKARCTLRQATPAASSGRRRS